MMRGARRYYPPSERYFIVRRAAGGFSFAAETDHGLAVHLRHLLGDDGFDAFAALSDVLARSLPGAIVRPRSPEERRAVLCPEVFDGAIVRSLEFVSIVADVEARPVECRARYAGRCRACGERIGAGALILWVRGRGAVHASCSAGSERAA